MTTWPTMWEIVGRTGHFDYIEFDSQSGAYDLHDQDNICRAAELTKTGSMLKVDGAAKGWLATRAIAAGFEAILFADVNTAEEAKQCVEAVRIAPEGSHGAAITRGTYADVDDWVRRSDDVVIAIMIERKTLMDNLEKVLRIDGLDMINFGPLDYGLSMRTPGKALRHTLKESELKEKIETDRDKINRKAIEAGIRPRVEADSLVGIQYFLERGIQDFCIGSDVNSIQEWCKENGKKIRDALGASQRVLT